ncbi:hypothetical protein GL273_20730 [Aeromonas jandaei]|uniref:hypothetical protein n=1 Tax=Aeromonas jandaei TaxID=650 RepID=UPI001C5A8E41|nr:hypothetical protein [Aeromonas jandaei]MBW3808186.1 hypothetical protein [Aeromonas jandaei]
MLQWLWSVWTAGITEAISNALLPTLGWGALLIGALQCLKGDDLNVRRLLSKVQLLVLVGTLLIMFWDGYWVLHPSKEEVQWQRGTNEYGLY